MTRVLVADDDRLFRRLLQITLEKAGHEAVLVQDGPSAARLLCEKDSPRLALLDWEMPGMDGPAVIQAVRAKHDRSYVHIILLTSRQDKNDVIEGLDAGADDYLTKPFYPPELLARLRTGERILLLEQKLVEAREEMRFKATHDSLTSLWNRGVILDTLQREITRASRDHGKGVSVLLCDVDHFKRVNDDHGHAAGDAVLIEVARRLASAVRGYDSVSRYGGEEFLLVLVNCPSDLSVARAEQIRGLIESKAFQTPAGPLSISMCLGVAGTDDWPALTSEQLIHQADLALYRAKQSGRNCTFLARPSGLEPASSSARKEAPISAA